LKVATHLIFAECCWFATSAVFDIHYDTPAVLAAAATSVLPDADHPRSWIGHQLGSVSEDLNRLFGHRSFLHSLLALALITTFVGLPLWWLVSHPAPMFAVGVGYGSHLLADMMTLSGVQLFWPSRLIAVFPGRDNYRVVTGGNSERVFVALAFLFALLLYPVSRVGLDGLIYRLGGSDQLYGEVTNVTDGDTITVETQGRSTPVRLIGVDTPETVAPDQPIGCYGKEASAYAKKVLTDRIVRLEIPRIGDSEDAYGRTLAYVYLDTDRDGSYEHLFNEDLITLGLARPTTFSHEYSRQFERLREEAEARGAGLWGACLEVRVYLPPATLPSLVQLASSGFLPMAKLSFVQRYFRMLGAVFGHYVGDDGSGKEVTCVHGQSILLPSHVLNSGTTALGETDHVEHAPAVLVREEPVRAPHDALKRLGALANGRLRLERIEVHAHPA
jgi:endonuclease YncB( thermonuclease family)